MIIVSNEITQTENLVVKYFLNLSAICGVMLLCLAELVNAQSFSETLNQNSPFSASTLSTEQKKSSDNPDLRQLTVRAKLSENSANIQSGLIWRVFDITPNQDGEMSLVQTEEGGSIDFILPQGNYLIHAAFGRASVTRRVIVEENGGVEEFVFNAGGLSLSAIVADEPFISRHLSFEIYSYELDKRGERTLIADNISANQIIRLNEGTYHVVSKYGNINAQVRADIRVQAGKLTKAAVEQRGAQIEVKLVSRPGGEAIADTAWSVQTQSGEEVFQSVNAQPNFILAEGSYVVVAQNRGKVVTKEFSVSAAKNILLELIAQ